METALGIVLGIGLGALLGIGTAAGMAEAAYRRGWRDAEQQLFGLVIREQTTEVTAVKPGVMAPGETIALN